MGIDYSLPKPTPGTSRATSPTETEILTDISDTVADVGSRLDTLEADTTAGDHIADPSGAHAASAVSIADAGGYYTATDVEGALQEVASGTSFSAMSGFGLISTFDPLLVGQVQTVGSANRTVYHRASGAGTISKVGLDVSVASGNICVAVYRNTGTGRSALPGTRLATSGSVACPTAGYAEVSLGASIDVEPGDWFALAADNTTASFRCATTSLLAGNTWAGRSGYEAAFPCPATPSVTNGLVRGFLLLGIA